METNILTNNNLTGLQKTYLIARDLKSSHQINESLWYAILEMKDQNIDEINSIDFADSIKESAYKIYGDAIHFVCRNIAIDEILQSADKKFLINKVRTCHDYKVENYVPLVSAIIAMSGNEYRNKLKSKSVYDYVMRDLGFVKLAEARKLLFS